MTRHPGHRVLLVRCDIAECGEWIGVEDLSIAARYGWFIEQAGQYCPRHAPVPLIPAPQEAPREDHP